MRSSAKSLPIAKLVPKGESALTQLSVTLSPCFAEGPDVYIGMSMREVVQCGVGLPATVGDMLVAPPPETWVDQ